MDVLTVVEPPRLLEKWKFEIFLILNDFIPNMKLVSKKGFKFKDRDDVSPLED